MRVSIVIPVFRGEHSIEDLFNRIYETLVEQYDFEVIFVFDGGKDRSWEVIKQLNNGYPDKVKGYHLSKNYGQHNALLFGLGKAAGDLIITMDEDLQHDPAYIPEMITELERGGFDIVYARFNELKNTRLRIMFSKLFRILFKRFIPYLFDQYSPYRVIKAGIAKNAILTKDAFVFLDACLSKVTSNCGVHSVNHYISKTGDSSYTYLNLMKNTLLVILAYSRIVLYTMLSSIFLLVIYLVLNLINYNFRSESGPALKILLYFALTLLGLSIIGEYINRRNQKAAGNQLKVYESTG